MACMFVSWLKEQCNVCCNPDWLVGVIFGVEATQDRIHCIHLKLGSNGSGEPLMSSKA